MCVCALCVCALCVCVRVVVSQARLRSVSIYSTLKRNMFCFKHCERNFVYLGINFKLILVSLISENGKELVVNVV